MGSLGQLTCAVCAVCAVCAMVTGLPVPTLMLEYVEREQRALCPLKVMLDVDHTRIPRVIKTVQCAVRTRHSSCCSREGVRHACTEVRDRVLVQYERGPHNVTTAELVVSVGCVCVRQEARLAADPPGPAR